MITNIRKVKCIKTSCKNCGTEFCFEREDIQVQEFPIAMCIPNEMYVVCPVCNEEVPVGQYGDKPTLSGLNPKTTVIMEEQ